MLMTSNTQGISPSSLCSCSLPLFLPHFLLYNVFVSRKPFKIWLLLIVLIFVIISLKCPSHLLNIHKDGWQFCSHHHLSSHKSKMESNLAVYIVWSQLCKIVLPTSAGSSKKQEFQKNIYFCFIDCAKPFDCVDHNNLWKILKEMGITDHLTCLLRNLYAGQEATVRTGHEKTDWFQIGEGVCQGCILSPCLFNFYAEVEKFLWEMLGWKKHKLESRLLEEISITSDMQMTAPLWKKVKRN